MPLRVSSPSTTQSVRTAVERNVIFGWVWTSKKSAERMCASRCSWRVSIEDSPIVTLSF